MVIILTKGGISNFMNILLVDAMISVSQKFQRIGENKCLNTLFLRTGIRRHQFRTFCYYFCNTVYKFAQETIKKTLKNKML